MRRDALIGWLLLFGGVIGWVYVGALGWLTAPTSAPGAGYRVHAITVPLPGLLMGLALVVLQSARPAAGETPSSAAGGGVLVALLVALAAALGTAVVAEDLEPLRAALLGVCGAVTLLVAWAAISAIRSEEGLSVETQWGGLGGGLGGFRLSRALSLVLMLFVFASATVAVGLYDPGDESKERTPAVAPKTATLVTEGS